MAQILKHQTCVPCRGDEPKATTEEIEQYHKDVPEWSVFIEGGVSKIRRVFSFKDFADALEFTNQIGQIAEEQGHHPALLTEWGKVTVTWWTHKIGGLHKNDFVMAAKTDEAYSD